MDGPRTSGCQPIGTLSGSDLYGPLLRRFAGGDFEDYIAAGGRPLRGRVARALALACLRPGDVVVDMGAGRGEAALHAARRGCRVVALDSSAGSLAIASETLGLRGGGEVTLMRADCRRVPLQAECAQKVLLLDVAEHLEPLILVDCLREARRILAPSGYVVIHTLPNRHALAAYRLIAPLVPGLPMDPRTGYERRVHVNELTRRDLARALAQAGLENRVWVEEWTTRYAARRRRDGYPDRVRTQGYRVLGRPVFGRLARALMRSRAADWVGNDIFALAWRSGDAPPPERGRMAPLR